MIYLNDEPINVTTFPDKTSQVWKMLLGPLMGALVVRWEFENEGEFMQLAQLKHLLVYEFDDPEVDLLLTYLPYGRQDKEVCNEATFALHTFAKLLNMLEFNRVMILDPHSQVALERIEHSHAVYPIDTLKSVILQTNPDIFCFPDHGALQKYKNHDVYGVFQGISFLYGEKNRDQSTGKILSYKLLGDPKDKKVLIVDDICDGGTTFIILAKDLLAAGAKEVNLFVTHGIFSKGLQVLKDTGINRIFTHKGEAK